MSERLPQLAGRASQPGRTLGLLPGRGQRGERLQASGDAEPLAADLVQPQRLGQAVGRLVVVAAGDRDPADPGLAAGDLRPGVELAEDLHRVGVVPDRHLGVAAGPGQGAHPVLDLRDAPAVVVAEYLERGLVRPLGRLQLALPDGDGRLGGLGQPGLPVVARRLGGRDGLLDVGHRLAGPACPRRGLADHPQRGRHREVVPAGPGQLQALGRAAHQRVVVLQVECDLRADRQGPPAHPRGHLPAGQDEKPVQPGGRLAGVAVRQPHVAQPDAQPQALVRLPVRQRRRQRDAEVAVLGDAAAVHRPAHRPGRLAAVEHRGDCLFHQRQDAVPVPQRQRVLLPGGLQPFGGVLPDRVQQPVPGVAGRLAVQHHQRLVD